MANFRSGTDEIRKTAENKGGGSRRFTPNIYWNDGDSRFVVFTTPAENITKVRLHQMVRIPDDKFERGYRYETFLCHKDPSMVEHSGGECVLCDHIGHTATEKFVALAVELEPVKEGKRVTGLKVKYNTVRKDDGTETDYPRWGVIVQGAKNFFSALAAYDESRGDITQTAFEIQRDGDSIGTKYHIFPESSPLPDLTEVVDEMPDLYDLLEEWGSDDQYAKLEGVEPGSQPTFGQRNATDSKVTTNGTANDRSSVFNQIKERVESY